MSTLFLVILSAVFSSDVERMGADDFFLREEATRRAKRFMPLNQYVIRKGLQSRDLEVRRRCKEVLIHRIDFTTIEECWQAYCIAYHILYREGSIHLSPGENVEVRRANPLQMSMFTLIARRDNLLPKLEPPWKVNVKEQPNFDAECKVEYVSLLRKRAQKVQEPYGH